MALNDLIANPGNPFMESYLRAEQGRRAEGDFNLRQQVGRQQLEQNQLKMQAQKQRLDRDEATTKLISEYSGPGQDLAKRLMQMGATDKAKQVVDLEGAIGKLSADKQKRARIEIQQGNAEALRASDMVLQGFGASPEAGMQAMSQVRERLAAKSAEAADRLPDPAVNSPDEIVQWAQRERATSIERQNYDERERHNIEIERTAKANAARLKKQAAVKAKRGYKKTKSDVLVELADKIAYGKASPEEIKKYDLLARTDPLDVAIRDALKRSTAKAGGEAEVTSPKTEKEYNDLPSGSVYIDPDDGKQYRKP